MFTYANISKVEFKIIYDRMVKMLPIFGVGEEDTNIMCSLICERGVIGR